MKSLALFFTFVTLVQLSLSVSNYNVVVDSILEGIKSELTNQSMTTVSLPDYTKMFDKKVIFFNMHGSVEAKGVTLGDFSTLRRFGSVDPSFVDKNNKTGRMSLMAVFSLDQLLLKIDQLKFDFALIHVDRPVNIQVEANRFALMVIMHLNETTQECQSELGFAMVNHLGDFQVTLGDSGFFSPSVERVDDIVLDWLVPDIENALNFHIRPAATKVVQQYSQEICSAFLN